MVRRLGSALEARDAGLAGSPENPDRPLHDARVLEQLVGIQPVQAKHHDVGPRVWERRRLVGSHLLGYGGPL